ncbi:two-component sensor histidine kinase [Paenibacillus selenitireducens]|uniref:histidine kinase n=1 Tax=Paenibacillus selenitireducens TaxID=1324314 RepID=A0A1T2X240_9BACL|nr:histidine kinase [Paenibacillus selenitireducens]OPA73932.1 two-component sensor histidine kinase [Paenibacillus selenitireducens]
MGLGSMYRRNIKNNVFIKLILLFSFMTIVTIITFSLLMYRSMSETVINRELDNQKKAMENVNSYFENKYDSAHAILQGVYRDGQLSAGVSYFLQHPFQEYIRHNLDQYIRNSDNVLTSGLQYFKNVMDDDMDISNLILYSTDQQLMYVYNPLISMKQISTNAVHSYIPDAMALEGGNFTLPSPWIRRAIDQWDTRLYSIRLQINDRQTLKNIGQMAVYYNADNIWRALASDKANLKGTILVVSSEGGVLFDSSGSYYGKPFPYMNQMDKFESSVLSESTYLTKLSQNKGGIVVIGMIPKEQMADAYQGVRNTILTISLICIFVAILIPSLFVIRFARRTNEIIRFTRKVKKGDLTARIQDPREDELGQISTSFNDMLDDLNLYIDRVYKAEIKQKHTELAALQARINPHFLYNTLEVIRMRAISQGAQDVGEMIYSLSALFRTFVQQKTIYLLKDELEACRLYLELFRIRYKDKFSYEIECDLMLGGKQVLQMSLQPIIENYIVHGLRTDRTDNRIHIRALSSANGIHVRIEDNGHGITSERLEEIRLAISPNAPEGESFGLRSVNERLKLLYGDEYGIELESQPEVGTIVNVWLPDLEDREDRHV